MTSIFDRNRTLEQRGRAVANLFGSVVKGGLADTRRMPSDVIDEGPQRTVHRYRPRADGDTDGLPVLMIPPLGSPATCFDLRRGCSMAEHFVAAGRPTYLVDYGPIELSDRDLGLEHWIGDVIPAAVRRVSDDTGGKTVQLVGWCMGGIFSLLTVAALPELPIGAVAMVASPFDFSEIPLLDPLRRIGKITGGKVVAGAARVLGGLPEVLVGPMFKLSSLPTYIKKPVTLFTHRDDREFLAQIEAVDGIMNEMYAYPGRATLQAYLRLLHKNELASGKVAGPTRIVDLADVRVRVMNIAGSGDVLAPIAAAHHVGTLLLNAAEARLETAPGGHLGVLTGRSAPTTTWAFIDDFFATHA